MGLIEGDPLGSVQGNLGHGTPWPPKHHVREGEADETGEGNNQRSQEKDDDVEAAGSDHEEGPDQGQGYVASSEAPPEGAQVHTL